VYGECSGAPKILDETQNILPSTLLRSAEELLPRLDDACVDVSPEGPWGDAVRQLEYQWGGFSPRYTRKLIEHVLLVDEAAADTEFPDTGKQELLDDDEVIIEETIEGVHVPLQGVPVRSSERR